MADPDTLRQASYALRITERKGGRAAIIYRRQADPEGRDRLQRVAALSPLAYSAALSMLRDAVAEQSRRLRSAAKAETATKGVAEAVPAYRSGAEEEAVRRGLALEPGGFLPLDATWGPRVACYALLAAGLRDGERLLRSAEQLRHAEPDQAAWWLGLLLRPDNVRALRALRILTEAVQ